MNFRKYVLMAAVCCLSVIFVSCDKEDDLPPSMAELNIEKLQSYHAAYMHIPADTRSAFPVISVQSPVSIQCCWQS